MGLKTVDYAANVYKYYVPTGCCRKGAWRIARWWRHSLKPGRQLWSSRRHL